MSMVLSDVIKLAELLVRTVGVCAHNTIAFCKDSTLPYLTDFESQMIPALRRVSKSER
jgi:hypothetical protein